MRIIAGSRKGARIVAPKGRATRPTGDRAREAAFNLIGPVDGARVLDLYAGSGAMGLEALSRGAEEVLFVEADREACRTIDRNLEKLGLHAQVLCKEVGRFLAGETRTFDLILCDPPYEQFEPLRAALARHLPRLLAENGLLVLETSSREAEPELSLTLRTSRRYGAARITLFEP